ncbi:MAG TPA: DUF4859 domain-containing protein [Prolixibacteraceae bacterium]|nr:DUF4859 domain-containing protein [Prolixibacteraceae bacterium]
MKKNIIYILLSCFVFAFVACSDSIEDATSKHVYGEDESPYLKENTDATITSDLEFAVGHLSAKTINLADYATKFQENMNMTVDQVISGLENGTVVFYNISVSRNIWNKAAMTKGSTGWYYNTAGGVTDDTQNYVASLDLDKSAKALVVNVNSSAVAGTTMSFNVGFAVKGDDYDDYVRFSFNISVTDPSIVLVSISIPTGDYSSYGIDFNSYASVIQTCMGMSVTEFLAALDYNGDTGAETGGSIHMHVIDPVTNVWDETSSYTAEPPGYWMNASGAVCVWNTTGFSLYANTKNGDQKLYIGRAPELATGTKFTVSVGYKDTQNAKNFFRFIITATLE